MKKVLSLLAVAGLMSLVACGPSKEEQEKVEKARMDSIAKVVADSTAAAEAAMAEKARMDSMAAATAAAEKMKADSMAAAAAKKGGKKK